MGFILDWIDGGLSYATTVQEGKASLKRVNAIGNSYSSSYDDDDDEEYDEEDFKPKTEEERKRDELYAKALTGEDCDKIELMMTSNLPMEERHANVDAICEKAVARYYQQHPAERPTVILENADTKTFEEVEDKSDNLSAYAKGHWDENL